MGCDIHMVAQVKRGEVWEVAECPPEFHDPLVVRMANEYRDCYWTAHLDHSWYDGRSYALFAALANVRNGYGFAGVPTHTKLVPIDEPRGFPDGFRCDSEYQYCGVWMGDHSQSWLTLRELEGYEWDQPLFYVRDQWNEPLSACVGDFLTRTVPALRTLGGPDDVRIVFGFDS